LSITVLYFLFCGTELYTRFVSSQTLGRVQLRFTDLKGDSLTVTRLMQLTQKAKNMEFKTKDDSLHRKNRNGEVSSSFLVLQKLEPCLWCWAEVGRLCYGSSLHISQNVGMGPSWCLLAGRQAFTAMKEGLSVIFPILISKMGFCGGLPFQMNRVIAN
jgi:hypothetical protein